MDREKAFIDYKDPEQLMDEERKKIMLEIIGLLRGKGLSVLDARYILKSASTKIKILAMHGKF